jgi:23S rRNA (guanosine2251-2'-O)-methyltransferase
VAEILREQPNRVLRLVVQADAKAHPARDVLVKEAGSLGIVVKQESADFFERLAPGRATQGIAADLRPFSYAALETVLANASATSIVLLLDGVTDPQNLGGILRSAAFFGVDAVVLPRDKSAEVTPTVERVACGGAAHISVCQVTNLSRAVEELKRHGYWVYGTVVDRGEFPYRVDLKGKVGLVLGSEGEGIRRLVREHCDGLISLPGGANVESLNVSVFAGLICYEVARQRAI